MHGSNGSCHIFNTGLYVMDVILFSVQLAPCGPRQEGERIHDYL